MAYHSCRLHVILTQYCTCTVDLAKQQRAAMHRPIMLLAERPLWPETYAEGRRCFLEACSAAGAAVVTHPHPLLGPDGAELATEVALVGGEAARRVLLVCTATHGVEGFTGSACLLQWLRAHADSSGGLLPPSTRAVLVHAINPHGYAWVRRVNEDNIDLNRNFIDHDAPRAPNALYTAAHPFVRPTADSPPDWSAADAGLAAVAEANGVSDAMRTVLGGQYEHADGIFYGGTRPAWSNEMIRRIVREHVGDTAERKSHDHCWHLGCILPRVPAIIMSNNRVDRSDLPRPPHRPRALRAC